MAGVGWVLLTSLSEGFIVEASLADLERMPHFPVDPLIDVDHVEVLILPTLSVYYVHLPLGSDILPSTADDNNPQQVQPNAA